MWEKIRRKITLPDRDKIKSWLKRFFSSYLFACFIVPSAIMLCVYAYVNVFPFGKSSVLIYDLNAQYVYFFEALRNCIYGRASFLYSFSRSLGGEFAGIYAYYLASPLSYIVALFPKRNIIDAIFFLLVVKTGLCGMSFGYFLKKNTKLTYIPLIIFSVMYATSSFTVVMQHNIMWVDGIYLLPLVITGLIDLIKYGKYRLYTLTLALSLLCNYYIGYMSCIFVFFAFFYFALTGKNNGRFPEKVRKFLMSLFRCGIFSIIAVAIAAIMIIPAYYSLTFGKTTFTQPNYGFRLKFNPAYLIYKSAITSYDTLQGDGLPFVFCGSVVLLLVCLYYSCGKISVREKIGSSIILAILTFSMCFDPIDMFWHGGQGPNCLNYRYAFILIFFVLYVGARAFENIRSVGYVRVISSFMLSCSFFIAGKLILKSNFKTWILAVQLSLIAAYAAVLLLSSLRGNRPAAVKVFRRYFQHILLLLTVAEFVFAGCFNIVSFKRDVGGSSRKSYVNYFDKFYSAEDYIRENDNNLFYRSEKTYRRTINDSYKHNYYGLSGSTSTLNYDTLKFLSRFGICQDEHWSKYRTPVAPIDSLLSVKYIYEARGGENKSNITSHYNLFYEDENVRVYENPYAFPLAFASVGDFSKINPDEILSPFDTVNTIFSEIYGEEVTVFKRYEDYTLKAKDCARVPDDDTIYVSFPSMSATLTYTIQNDRSRDLYMYFSVTDNTDVASVTVNSEEFGDMLTMRTNYPIYLSAYDTDVIEVVVTFNDAVIIDGGTPLICEVDYGELEKVSSFANENAVDLSKFTGDKINGTTNLSEDMTIFTTIPYDKGWNVKIDGSPVQTREIYDALLSFEIPGGEHTVKLNYMPRCYVYALVISLTGVAAFAIIVTAENKSGKIKKESEDKST